MKLLYILLSIIVTLSLEFIISIALDSVWVDAQIVRQIIIYVAMIAVLYVGFLVYQEIIKTEFKK